MTNFNKLVNNTTSLGEAGTADKNLDIVFIQGRAAKSGKFVLLAVKRWQ